MSGQSLLTETVQTVPASLSAWAAATPDAIALLAPGREPITYRDLEAAVARLATALRARGYGRQDGIAVLLPDGPDFSLALLAAMSAGVAVPLAWPNPETEYRPILTSRRVRAIVASAAIPTSALAGIDHGLPVITCSPGPSGWIGDFRVAGPSLGAPAPECPAQGDDIAVILHSSGTTGRPKLVPRTHHSIVSTCRGLIEARGLSATDRCLSSGRATYSQGITALALPIVSGASLISIPGFDLSALPAWLHAYQPTYLSTTPAVLRTLAGNDELRQALQCAPLRCVHSTAAPLPAAETRHLEDMLGVPILIGYGMSEAAAIAGERFPALRRVPGSVGRPWCELQILDEGGAPVAAPVTGEIVVRGPRVFPGYLDDDEANEAAFLPGGWFRTGDVGFLDTDGFLHLTGRLSEIINRGGEKIVPREVDDVLRRHAAVAEAAAFGAPNARLGEDVVVAVVLKPGMSATARELRAWMFDRLAAFKVPRRIWFVDHLPRTPTGKVQRGELARRWIEDHP